MNTAYFLNCVAGNIFRTKSVPEIPSNYYIGLSTTSPNSDGTGVSEPSALAGYTRIQLVNLSEPVNGVVTNQQPVAFNEATNDWGTVTHFVIYDSPVDGNLLMYGVLDTPRNVDAETIIGIKSGFLKLAIQNPL